jgi:hypothetical protein
MGCGAGISFVVIVLMALFPTVVGLILGGSPNLRAGICNYFLGQIHGGIEALTTDVAFRMQSLRRRDGGGGGGSGGRSQSRVVSDHLPVALI